MLGTILVGTAGQGILRSSDNGASWHRLGLKEAIEFDGTVRSLAVDPADPSRIFAGADVGICVSHDGGAHFSLVDSPANGQAIWSLAFSPCNPKLIYAGSGAPARAHMYRSRDGGKSWEKLSPEFPEFCAGVNRPRILTICAHPQRVDEVWFGVEEGGAWRSSDAGDTWDRIDCEGRGINSSDIHCVALLAGSGGQPEVQIVATVNSICHSLDNAQSFDCMASKDRFGGLYYTRTVCPIDPEGHNLLLAVGDGTPGTRTRIYRSDDRGQSWTPTVLHTEPNSTVWGFGVHPSNPHLIFAGTKYGHLLRSVDGGRSWYKEWRDFSEITSVAWTPYVAPIKAHPKSV
ncbi:glycosyl hydrolase [Bordetella sp. 15P40C-2]|uniref:WD40/YVTN/BNR-like repeat-containing protein n=1 Tax=Bordetella sp. 15P40C-2 TaxID=2572246 RepID=UPI001320D78C|nr:glycosyl hydrolase [Bordetella sp. 15P40C-2]MVW71520.1 glycosyl hydrolase [Bordetella sp. 15P40C-2]